MENERNRWQPFLIWIARILVGGVFIFSGFSKAVDPWGTLYKVDDYLNVMGLTVWPNLVLVGVFFLCGIEFLTGIFLFLGSFRRSSPVMGGLIMLFMLPLSLWIAIKNPVPDCGCFGDALIISNWATFWKNVILSAVIVWLIRRNIKCRWLVTPALQWLLFLASGLFIVVIELFGYVSQPLIDFREYKVGEALLAKEGIAEENPHFTFIYEKDGVRKEFGENDSLPDEADGWTFIERQELNDGSETKTSKDKSLRIWDEEDDDVTEEAITFDGPELLVMIPDLKGVSPATTWKLNSLYEWSVKNGIQMIGIVAGDEEDIEDWKDLSMASYPVYHADDTHIKEVVRGNPGIVYLKNGSVVWKSTLTAINIDDFVELDESAKADNFGLDNQRILLNCFGMYLIVVCVLIFLSFTPQLGKTFFKKKAKRDSELIHDDTVHPSE